MFKSRVLFVVGAGASAEVDLPTGAGLKQAIVNLLMFRLERRQLTAGDRRIAAIIRRIAEQSSQSQKTSDAYYHAAQHIVGALPQAASIDNMLSR